MGLILKDKLIVHSIEFENLYVTIENFRRLSDLQMEVTIGFYRSPKDKINGIKALDSEIKVFNITKNQLSILPIYTILYAKLNECYSGAIPITSDDITESPEISSTIEDHTITGKMAGKFGVVTVGYDFLNKIGSVTADENGAFSMKFTDFGMTLHSEINLTFTAKETDKKASEPKVTKIVKNSKGVLSLETV